jgi:hypothetical protein
MWTLVFQHSPEETEENRDKTSYEDSKPEGREMNLCPPK